MIQQDEINAYAVTGNPGMSWVEGKPVVHLAGCWVLNECNKQWKEYMDKRTTVAALKKQTPIASTPVGSNPV